MKINSILDLFASSRGTPYGSPTRPTPPPSSGPGMLAPWWTGTTDEFNGQPTVLGPAPEEHDIRKVLQAIYEQRFSGGNTPPALGGGWTPPQPGGWVPPQPGGGQPVDDPNAPADTGMLSRGSGFGAAYRRYRDSKNQD